VIAVIIMRRAIGLRAGSHFAAAVETRTIFTGTFLARPLLAGAVVAGRCLAGPVVTLITILTRGTVIARPLGTRFTVLANGAIIAALIVARTIISGVATLLAALGTILTRAVVALLPVFTRPIVTGPILTGPILTLVTILPRRLLAWLLGRPRIELTLDLVAVLVELLLRLGIVLPRAVGVRFLISRPAFGEHAKIMVGELEIIFGENPVAGLLRIARQRLVFFEQLRSIATRPIVDAIAEFGASVLRALAILATPAATATGLLTIVDQADAVLNKGGVQIPFCPNSCCRIRTAGRSAASPNQSIIAEARRMWG